MAGVGPQHHKKKKKDDIHSSLRLQVFMLLSVQIMLFGGVSPYVLIRKQTCRRQKLSPSLATMQTHFSHLNCITSPVSFFSLKIEATCPSET